MYWPYSLTMIQSIVPSHAHPISAMLSSACTPFRSVVHKVTLNSCGGAQSRSIKPRQTERQTDAGKCIISLLCG